MEELKQSNRLELKLADLKSILIHNENNVGGEFVCIVPPSRFRKILNDYHCLNGIYVEGLMDTYSANYKSYLLSGLNDKTNSYLIVKDKTIEEKKGKCSNCNCDKLRWINSETGTCYYIEMIKNNYTTKIINN